MLLLPIQVCHLLALFTVWLTWKFVCARSGMNGASSQELHATIFFLLPICGILSGILIYVFGYFDLGKLLSSFPFPVNKYVIGLLRVMPLSSKVLFGQLIRLFACI
jgi:hypothetical protein